MVQRDNEQTTAVFPGDTIGILGASGVCKELTLNAKRMGFRVITYVTTENNDISQLADFTIVDRLDNVEHLQQFAERCKIILFDPRLMDTRLYAFLNKYTELPQGSEVLEMSQDRVLEKAVIAGMGIDVVPYVTVVSLDDIYENIREVGFPAQLLPTWGSPNNGLILKSRSDIPQANRLLDRGSYILQSQMTDGMEIVASVVKDMNGHQNIYPMVENVYNDGRLTESIVPARCSDTMQNTIVNLVDQIASQLTFLGTISIKFLINKNRIFVKEVQPGLQHEQNIFNLATNVNVYEETLRSVCGMSLADIKLETPAVMFDVLSDQMSDIRTQWLIKSNWNFYLNAFLMNKKEEKTKIGYVLVSGENTDQILEQIDNTSVL
ncbi:5-(carboxyamino)imidazole ribonucleotide synthase [Pediococcus claussenii]|uniref:5-(carboxyamino)imidazole ribonucleotide synthase n=1 Tax=Pediococcus claussenii TaxID=187452 RepID=UPI0003118391|nr:ATP-grasp domain-containing protein [Pediococcus claussenii]ANZ69025.1 hypothetical protein AYR57_01335 [Pediococcus claussenii]ANZ70841.1 hypothetical protein AYR58_01335 [Pediococcus claussenii]